MIRVEGAVMYILKGKVPVREPDLLRWAEWFEKADREGERVVGKFEHQGVTVSTVFLGCDHGFGAGPPMLFETMIFGGQFDEALWRFATWDEAEAHHMATCKTVRETAKASST